MKTRPFSLLLLRIVFVLLASLGSSGLSAQTVPGYVISDDPDHLIPCSLTIIPLYVNAWKPNGSTGLNMDLMIHAGKFIDMDFDLMMAYKEHTINKDNNPLHYAPFNNESFILGVNALGEYSARSYNVNYHGQQKLTGVSLTRRVTFATRLGFGHYGTTFNAEDCRGYFVSGVSGDTSAATGIVSMDLLYPAVGFSIKNIYNAKVNADGEVLRRGKWAETYFDGLYNVKTGFAPHYQASDTGRFVMSNRRSIGFRFGVRIQDPSHSNFCFGVEYGVYPGAVFISGKSYFLFKLGFSVADSSKD